MRQRLWLSAAIQARYALQVPYLEDPNTNKAMFESSKIVSYLNDNYALA